MFIDAQTELWSAAALTATAVSTNCYDLGVPYTSGGTQVDPGEGEPLALIIAVGVAADHTTGDETYEFDVISATATDLTTGQIIHSQHVFTAANLAAGRIHVIPIVGGEITQRYLGAKYVGGGTTPTITVTAWIAPLKMAEHIKRYYSTASTTSA